MASRLADTVVNRLVLVEVHALAGSPSGSRLSKWPESFPNRAEAMNFFESQRLNAKTRLQGLEARDGAYWRRFCRNDMLAIEHNLRVYDFQSECARISAPTLVLAGATSWLDRRGTRETAALIRGARYVEINRAGHDVHLDPVTLCSNPSSEWHKPPTREAVR
jgi:pimeloyl-ACP methyl ester carboxylesterase